MLNKTIAPLLILVTVLSAPAALAVNAAPTATRISPVSIKEVACSKELKICPDGSSVARTGSNCQFAPCPADGADKPSSAQISAEVEVSPPAAASSLKRCGINTYRVFNECGVGAFKNIYFQCYDEYEENRGGESSCKSSSAWSKYAREACANRCGAVEEGVVGEALAKPISAPKPPKPLPTPAVKPTISEVKPIPVCYIPDKLSKDYKQLILELNKAEKDGDKKSAELIIKKITALKAEITEAREKCLANSTIKPPTIQPRPSQTSAETTSIAAPTTVDRCQEISQWENKIAYYQKLDALGDSELKEQSGFSREEIKKILMELPRGLVKVKEQCENQKTAEAKPTEIITRIVAEPVKPVSVESGDEIKEYYKAKIESIAAEEESADVQVAKLKILKSEVDELVGKFLKGRKELEASELSGAVTEVKINRGEIRVDDVAIKTADKKILLNIGEKAVSVAPTDKGVIIKDENLAVTASQEVSIKEQVLRVGKSEVRLVASEVANRLGIKPFAAELKEEKEKAIYKFKAKEPRKLLGFIPINITKTLIADARSGNLLEEDLPWYAFLTVK